MSQSDILELAKRGEPRAIAAILNHLLKSRNVAVRTHWKSNCLHVLLEAERIINQTPAVNLVQQVLTNLQSPNIELVQIYGRRLGQKSINWYEKISLSLPQSDSSPLISESDISPASDQQEVVTERTEIEEAAPIPRHEEKIVQNVLSVEDSELLGEKVAPSDLATFSLQDVDENAPVVDEVLESHVSSFAFQDESNQTLATEEDISELDASSFAWQDTNLAMPDVEAVSTSDSLSFGLVDAIEPTQNEEVSEFDGSIFSLQDAIDETFTSSEETPISEAVSFSELETIDAMPATEEISEPDALSFALLEENNTTLPIEESLELDDSSVLKNSNELSETEEISKPAPLSFSLLDENNEVSTISEFSESDDLSLALLEESDATFSIEKPLESDNLSFSLIEDNDEILEPPEVLEPDTLLLSLLEDNSEMSTIEEILEPDALSVAFLEESRVTLPIEVPLESDTLSFSLLENCDDISEAEESAVSDALSLALPEIDDAALPPEGVLEPDSLSFSLLENHNDISEPAEVLGLDDLSFSLLEENEVTMPIEEPSEPDSLSFSLLENAGEVSVIESLTDLDNLSFSLPEDDDEILEGEDEISEIKEISESLFLDLESEVISDTALIFGQEEISIQNVEPIQLEHRIQPENCIQSENYVQMDVAATSEGSNMAQNDDISTPETSMPELPATGLPQDDRVESTLIEPDSIELAPLGETAPPGISQAPKAELLNKPEAIALIAFAIMLLLWDTYIAIMEETVSGEKTSGKGFQSKSNAANRLSGS
ncbi:MAG: hypothetical protein KME16_16615 [Scytolyngbya sp. HA4215-MV1]|jgi:hypothetical protein|nr:hypothetical protein [Scytolyngbya sp. HA4215-MV1]